jgi:hypothetical protein
MCTNKLQFKNNAKKIVSFYKGKYMYPLEVLIKNLSPSLYLGHPSPAGEGKG